MGASKTNLFTKNKMKREKYKILFVCVHNGARRQIAEAFLNEFGKEQFEAGKCRNRAGQA